MTPDQWAALGASVVLILGFLSGLYIKYAHPRVKAIQTFGARLSEAVLGRPPVLDAYNHELSPAILPLAEQQLAVQRQIGELTGVVKELVSHREEIETVKADVVALRASDAAIWARVNQIDADVKSQRMERIAGHIDSAAAWRAVETLAPNNGDDTTPTK